MAFVTVREQILQNLTALFTSMEIGLPALDPYTIAFDYVRRNPLDEESWKKLLTLGVHDTRESVEKREIRTDRTIDVVLEWRRTIRSDEVTNTGAASSIANEILGNIQRRLEEDYSLGGLAVDVTETANEVYIDDFDQRQLSGAVMLQIFYRTMPNDPRVAV